jgi:hypothetical protein
MDALKHQFQNLQTRWILKVDQIQNCLKCGAIRRVKGGREKVRAVNSSYAAMRSCPGHEWSELKGDIELKEFPYWQSDFEAFLAAKRLWEWENEHWLKRAGYL